MCTLVLGVVAYCGDWDVCAGACAEPLSDFEIARGYPLLEFWHPEGVGVGGDYAGTRPVSRLGRVGRFT